MMDVAEDEKAREDKEPIQVDETSGERGDVEVEEKYAQEQDEK